MFVFRRSGPNLNKTNYNNNNQEAEINTFKKQAYLRLSWSWESPLTHGLSSTWSLAAISVSAAWLPDCASGCALWLRDGTFCARMTQMLLVYTIPPLPSLKKIVPPLLMLKVKYHNKCPVLCKKHLMCLFPVTELPKLDKSPTFTSFARSTF